MRSWRATPAETKRALPGDELVPEPRIQITHAVTIAAPVERVWPWLAQIGQDRGGFYSYEWLENLAGCEMRNADRVHPEWLVAVATIGTTLAPWGLAFIQSYAVDKGLRVKDLRFERIDVITGAVLTGVIGLFVIVACAATLFGLGFLAAALLAAAIVPLSTAYSISETLGRKADLNDSFAEARSFYLSFGAVVGVAAVIVLIPGRR